MGPSRSKCFITPLSFYIFIGKGVCHVCVWYDEYLWRIYQKWTIFTLAHIFAYNSKSTLPQRASFSHAETHIVLKQTKTAGPRCMTDTMNNIIDNPIRSSSSSSFGCGAGDHKISPTAAILGQRKNIVWLQHPIRISQEVLNIFQVQCVWPSWLTLPMRWNI